VSDKNALSRRDLLQSGAVVAAGLALPGTALALDEMQRSGGKPSPLRLGLASYTFRNFTRAQMIDFMKQLKVFDLNAKDVKDHLPMNPEGEARAVAEYNAAGIKLHAAGAFGQSSSIANVPALT
jgi:hypothetical protein